MKGSAGGLKAIMDGSNVGSILVSTIGSFTQDRLINREQRLQHKEQCAERLAAQDGGSCPNEVRYAEQAVLANLDWGIDALEEAIGTSNVETKMARLEHAEKMLQVCAMLDGRQTTAGVPNFYLSAWAHLNLAFVWKLRNNDRNAVVHILEMFLVDPLFSRIDFAPELWESLFLPHLRSIVGWYTEERHGIVLGLLPDSADLSFSRDEYRTFSEPVLSAMSPDQAQRLQQLEKLYQDSLDENTRLYARYFKDWINFDPALTKKGMPLMPIAEPPMTPRHELSRLIPQSVKFGPVPPKSAGFSSVFGVSVNGEQASAMCGWRNTRLDELEGLSRGNSNVTPLALQAVWEEEDKDGRSNGSSTTNEYNGDIEMDSQANKTISIKTWENSKFIPSRQCSMTLTNTHSSVISKPACVQPLEKHNSLKSKRLLELLRDPDSAVPSSSPRIAYSSEDSSTTLPEQEPDVEGDIQEKSRNIFIQSKTSFGDSNEGVQEEDEDEDWFEETEVATDYRTFRTKLAESSSPTLISSPMTESEEEISQSNFLVQSSGKSTPQTRPPKDFVCPITSQLFTDPVTLETGQTYERRAIQEWLERGNTTCPITRQTLGSTVLPKTNYVLKRLIASWKEQHPDLALEFSFSETPRPSAPISIVSSFDSNYPSTLLSQCLSANSRDLDCNIGALKPSRRFARRANTISSSPTSVISQAAVEAMMSELRLSVSCLCTSEDLQECESAVLTIARVWQDSRADPIIKSHLARPAIMNGFVEILSNSLDLQVLRAAIYILSELAKDEIVAQTLTRVDSDFESLVALLKKGLVEAAVLVYQMRPSFSQLSFHDLVPSLVHIIIAKSEETQTHFPLCLKPKDAAIVMLEQMLAGGDESTRSLNALTVISMNGLPSLIESLESKSLQGRSCAVSILLCCMQADGSCRNLIAHRAQLAMVLELFHSGNDRERSISVAFISELVRLNRRTFNNQVLQIIKDEGTFSTMHMFLVYLQMAPLEQRPIVASLLLQLDLLVEPRKMSMYREEAIETLVQGLKSKEFLISQITAAETIVALAGRMSWSGKSLTEAWLLRTAGFDKHYNTLMKAEQPPNVGDESPEYLVEEEKAAEDWERRVAFVLVNYEFGAIFEALGECLKSTSVELARPCLIAATWLTHMVLVMPDTGIRDAIYRCLIEQFIIVLQSSRSLEERVLAVLALSSFINDSEGLKEMAVYAKRMCKPLKQLKKHSSLAADVLRALLNLPLVNVSELWNHTEAAQADSSMNGEILSLVHCRGRVFSGHSDGTVKVWDARKRVLHLIQEVREHTRSVTCVSASSSGEKLYSGSLDKTVRVWAIGLEEIHCMQIHDMKDPIHALNVSNSMFCFIPQGTGIKIHNWNGSSKLVSLNRNVKCLAMGEGKLYCGCTDYSIQEIDLISGTSSTLHSGARKLLGQKPIYALQIHDNLLYAGGSHVDGVAAKVWSLSTNSLVGSLSTTADIRCIAVNNEFIFLGSKSGVIEVWLRERLVRVGSLNAAGSNKVMCLAVDVDGELLFSGSKDGRIRAWSLN